MTMSTPSWAKFALESITTLWKHITKSRGPRFYFENLPEGIVEVRVDTRRPPDPSPPSSGDTRPND
jgi:hypothetical protein